MPIQRRRLLRALASGGVLVALALTNGASEPMAGAQARTFAIHDIQGAAAQSPLGEIVAMSGIITARKSNGFFIQAH